MLQTYHVQQSSAENLVGIGFLGIAFAFAVAQKYQESFPGAIVPVATLVYPPSIVGLLVYGMIQGQLWHVPAGDLLLQHEVASQEEGAGDGDELFSDDGDNDDGESEEDDEELARRLQNEDVPQELRVDSPGSRTISPIATEQRLRSRKPVVYRS
jgi:phage-related protein